MSEPARILERGYRAYEGERGGVGAAMRTTVKHSIQRSLGMKRTIWQKVLPVISIALAYIPAVVFVGLVALSERFRLEGDVGPSYAEYYGFVTAAILVFCAFVAPEILCTDRRSGMLGLYLASPLNRNTYLLSKTIAVLAILSIVTTGPVLLVLIGKTIMGRGPDGVDGWFLTLARIVLSGLVVSALHTALSLAVASLTSRRAVASATIVMLLIATSASVDALIASGSSVNLRALHLFGLPFQLVYRVYGERWTEGGTEDEVSTLVLLAANVGWTLFFALIVWWRYRRLTVTK
jgi:ABC-2 type transport system permease protein